MSLFGGVGTFLGRSPPVLMTGKVVLPQYLKPCGTGAPITSGRIYYAPIILPGNITYSGMKTYNSGTGDNGNKIKMAAYFESATGGPGALAKSFGEVTLDGTAAIRSAASSWTPGPGLYFLAFAGNAAISMYTMISIGRDSAAGYILANPITTMLGGFASDYLAASNDGDIFGDYVSGTYSSFPADPATAPTNTIMGVSVVSAIMPIFGLYK